MKTMTVVINRVIAKRHDEHSDNFKIQLSEFLLRKYIDELHTFLACNQNGEFEIEKRGSVWRINGVSRKDDVSDLDVEEALYNLANEKE